MKEFFTIVGLLTVVFAGIFGVSNFLASYACSNYEEETGIQTKFRTMDSCYIKTPTGFMRWDEFKARATTREQTK